MESNTLTLSPQYQITIPKKIRSRLKLKPKDELMAIVGQGRLILQPKPKSWAKYAAGLGKEVWEGIDIEEYIRELREEWEK